MKKIKRIIENLKQQKKIFLIAIIFILLIIPVFAFSYYYPENVVSKTINPITSKMVFLAQLDLGSKKGGSGTITATAEKRVLIQTEVDPYFPCYIKNENTIKCEAITEEKKNKYSNELSLTDKADLSSKGIPIKNIHGNVIKEKNIDWNKDTEIKVDLSNLGSFKIGFASNMYNIVDLSVGVFNQTHEVGNVYLDSGKLIGNYFSQILDLNTTKTISNVSFAKSPADANIYVSVRSHNMTNTTDVLDDLYGYYKLDGDATDFSKFTNNTGTLTGAIPFNVSGYYDGAGEFSDGKYITVEDDDSLDFADQVTIIMWVNPSIIDTSNRVLAIKGGNFRLDATRAYTNTIIWGVGLDGAVRTTAGGALPTNKWTQVAVTYSSTTQMIYIYQSGHQTGSRNLGSFSNKMEVNTENLEIGGSAGAFGEFDGKIDEVMIFNRTLSQSEIIELNNSQLSPWSDWSSDVYSDFGSISVDDGRFVQIKSGLEREDPGSIIYLENFTIGYREIGAEAPYIDNVPIVTLETEDNKIFDTRNATLNISTLDDFDIVNISIFTNHTGTWKLNATVFFTGDDDPSANASFVINTTADGTYIWNALACDNSTAVQCEFASLNKTFEITECVDTDCYPYLCNDATGTCYKDGECTSHSFVNDSSFCNADRNAETAYVDTLDCAFKEYATLDDDPVCTSQLLGFCYPDIQVGEWINKEFCTDASNGCVHDNQEYGQSEAICDYGDGGNNHFLCSGTDGIWTETDCGDSGDPFNAIAKTVLGHTYCGYYSAQSCNTNDGCTPTLSSLENDCGNYFYNETSKMCGNYDANDDKYACDTNCMTGCTPGVDCFDLDICNEGVGYTLSADCLTCTPPPGDNPPAVTLKNPSDGTTINTLQVEFEYTVSEDHKIVNCSLYHNSTGNWHLNLTNLTAVDWGGVTSNYFYQNFSEGDIATWNIECYDNSTEGFVDWGVNRTFTIDTTYEGIIGFEIYNQTENAEDMAFGVFPNEGFTNATGDLYVEEDLSVAGEIISPDGDVDIPKLKISNFLDFIASGLTGVRFSNPFSEYIKFQGKASGGNILFGLYESNPLITTLSGSKIKFGKDIEVDGDAKFINTNITGNLYVTNINPDGDALYIGGEFGDGGITMQDGDIFAQTLTLEGGSFTAEGGTVTGDWVPTSPDVYDLGNYTNKWRHLFARDINVTEVYINNLAISPFIYNMTTATTDIYGKWWYNETLTMISKSNIFQEQQIFSKGMNVTGNITFMDETTKIQYKGANTTIWLDGTGNINTKYG